MLASLKHDLAPLVLRLVLGIIFISHGYLKLQLDAGAGRAWAAELPIHEVAAQAVAWGELVGGVALALGLLSRLAALGIAIIQVGAIGLVRGANDFIPASGLIAPNLKKGMAFTLVGYEYNAALLAMCVAVILLGSGIFSVDHLLFGRRKDKLATTAGAAPESSTAYPQARV